MEQPYAYPQVTGQPAPLPPQINGITGVIVHPRFCVSYPVEIAIVRKLLRLKSSNFVITDLNGEILFKVNDPLFGVHDKRILSDSSGSPVLTLREKIMTMHKRWQVFRGGSKKHGDLLYTVKKSSMIQFTTKLNVYLSHNIEENICDFRVKGNRSVSSCIVYAGESDVIVAKMEKKLTVRSVLLGKDHFSVTVNPYVDYAFIASLIVILEDVNHRTSFPILDVGTSVLSM